MPSRPFLTIPAEIQRTVFEMAALDDLDDRETFVNLCLVAKYVHAWFAIHVFMHTTLLTSNVQG